MFKDENRHYSLRKLSVGLASVLIGISFASSMNGNSVKADTVSAQTSAIETKTSENKVNMNVDATKEVVKDQKITNQSNNHAEDNSQTQPQNSQKLDITKNSKKFAKKVLTTNLTETNGSTQAINDSTDPSKIDTSHFMDGTHWTTAGWTRTDKNTKVAKKSSLILSDWTDGHNDPTVDETPITNVAHYYAQDLNFTIDKDDLKTGNKILVATIQHLPTNVKQKTDGTQPSFYVEYGQPAKYDITYNNQTIGTITTSQLDKDELDYYFNPTTTLNLASDPNFTYHLKTQLVVGAYARQQYRKNHTNLPSNYCIVSNSNVREYGTYVDKSLINLTNQNNTISWYSWYSPNPANPIYAWVGLQIKNLQHQLDPTVTNDNDFDYVVKIQTLDGTKFDISQSRMNVTSYVNLLDKDGKLTTEELYEIYDVDAPKAIKATDNLSSIDLWNATAAGHASYSVQKDGSVLLCMKLRPTAQKYANRIDKNRLKSAAEGSYLANVQDPDHFQQIVDNTVNKTKGWTGYISSFQLIAPASYQITDVTPTAYSKHNNLGTTTMQ